MTVGALAGTIALAGGVPAWANAGAPAAAPQRVAAQALSQTQALSQAQASSPEMAAAVEEARKRVTSMAKTHPAAEVRTSAWNALRSTRGDQALLDWLAPGGGFDGAKQRARDTRARNKAFCERVVATHTAAFSPQVRAAATRALKGTAAEQAAFVASGYAEAQRRDRAAREAGEQQRLDVAAADREFVRTLGTQDPGGQVRVAAQWALRPGASDADVAEFFGYGWATGATLDLSAYRTRVADAEAVRHHTLTRLIAEATAAEAAVAGAADAARARAEAERAWQAVSEHAGAARRAWQAEQAAAAAQAENWRTVAQLSRDSAERLWQAISGTADDHETAWSGERAAADEAAAFWKAMFDRAQDGESRARG
ncbi:hypothetical protein [Streptomyces ficellus]|uniref:Chemotaxis protein n=1 Tax=Streptomyces ficellus TaxID=1977088 RepID=A0A6I6F8K9_9ACTN|nr:hypothetical protein [Streptomyces ficellus]QGV77287.1 hypothetical protein EIZ62_02720 [Streptomyces ficellus]